MTSNPKSWQYIYMGKIEVAILIKIFSFFKVPQVKEGDHWFLSKKRRVIDK